MVNTVPRCFPGETVVILGSGPSLTAYDVGFCEGEARVIAIKDSIRLAPWADVFYCCGGEILATWWQHYGWPDVPLKYTLDPKAAAYATLLRNTGITGLELNPTGLRTGKNSGYQAINLAVHLGAKRIVLLGFDMQPAPDGKLRWFGQHPYPSNLGPEQFKAFKDCFETIVQPLKDLGVEVVNASRQTSLTCFPRMSLEDALAGVPA